MQRVYRHETRAVLAELDLGTRQREALGVAAEAVIAHRSCVAGQWQAHTGRRGERFISREEGLSDTLRQSWIAQVLKPALWLIRCCWWTRPSWATACRS
jgi:hypothetical protein